MLSDLWYTNIIIIICKSVDNLFVEQLTGGIVMNKKITIIYLVIAVLGIICTVFTALAFNAYVYDREPDGEKETVYFSDKMDMRVENGVYIYSAILPDITENKVIAYDTAHIFLDVTIDGEPVYTLTVKTGQWMKTTGYRWNFINLIEEDGGKEIIFRACPAYSDTKPKGEIFCHLSYTYHQRDSAYIYGNYYRQGAAGRRAEGIYHFFHNVRHLDDMRKPDSGALRVGRHRAGVFGSPYAYADAAALPDVFKAHVPQQGQQALVAVHIYELWSGGYSYDTANNVPV